MNHYAVQFFFKRKFERSCILIDPINADIDLSDDMIASRVIEGDNVSVCFMGEKFFVQLKKEFIIAENEIHFLYFLFFEKSNKQNPVSDSLFVFYFEE